MSIRLSGNGHRTLSNYFLDFVRARIVLVTRARRSSVQHGADYYEHRWRRIGICQNASHRLVVQTAKFVFCLHNIPNRGAVQTERLGLVIERVVPTFDQRIRDELSWDSPTSAI